MCDAYVWSQYSIAKLHKMFQMIYTLFSCIYSLFYLFYLVLSISFNLVTFLSFLYLIYMCIIKIHQLCKILAHMKQTSHEPSLHYSEYHDDIEPDDSVSVVYQDSIKESDSNEEESAFENIDSYQVG